MDIKSKIKEPFDKVLEDNFARLEAAAREFEASRDVPKGWNTPKGNIRHCVLPQFNKWAEARKRIQEPFRNLKTFRRENRRVRRARGLTWFHGRAFFMRVQMLLMGMLFIVKLPIALLLKIPMALFKRKKS